MKPRQIVAPAMNLVVTFIGVSLMLRNIVSSGGLNNRFALELLGPSSALTPR